MNKIIYFIILIVLNLVLVSYVTTDKPNIEDAVFTSKQQDSISISDGPYIFIKNDTIIETNIVRDTISSKILNPNNVVTHFEGEPSTFTNVSKIAAISDIHGQFDLTTTILKNNGIIDSDLNWAFGNGHLVFVGDIFDRGPKVTELLWLVYKLEKQAIEKGGMVHFILGNHEYMTMQDDLRYINKKYRRTEQLLKIPYSQLYDENMLMGRWLRSKSTIIKINDNLFVHGGISKEFFDNDFQLDETNIMMRQSLYEKDWTKSTDSIYNKYYNNFGPIWYRGYFDVDFKKKDLNKLLKKLKVNHIIVGHTPHRNIMSLFDNKILAIDTGIQLGRDGELLLIENGSYFIGTSDGQKIEIK